MPIAKTEMHRAVMSKRIVSGSEYVKKNSALQILKRDHKTAIIPYVAEVLNRVEMCQKHHRCNSPWCPTCSNPRASKSKRKNVKQTLPQTQGLACLTTTQAKSGEYRVRGGQRMMTDIEGLPLVMCHPVTINVMAVPVNGSIGGSLNDVRIRIRRMLDRMSNGAICRGKFDIVLKWIDELEFDFHVDEWPGEIDPTNLPHKRYAMLHFHGVIFDPLMSHREVRTIIAAEFPGAKRVCLRHAEEVVVMSDGTMIGGLQGYLEYASMEKIEISFGDESADAVLDFARIDSTWKRANRNFSYGKAVHVSGVQIDRKRQAELERKQRLDRVKTNWSKMNFAEKFIYQWLSDASDIASSAKQQSLNRSDIRKRFNDYFLLHCNWCSSIWYETLEFVQFLKLSHSELAEKPPKMIPT
ncbi:MAG: hypothetical protein ABJH63_18605 [Rhizobiaceae bacterium]